MPTTGQHHARGTERDALDCVACPGRVPHWARAVPVLGWRPTRLMSLIHFLSGKAGDTLNIEARQIGQPPTGRRLVARRFEEQHFLGGPASLKGSGRCGSAATRPVRIGPAISSTVSRTSVRSSLPELLVSVPETGTTPKTVRKLGRSDRLRLADP